MNDWAAVATAFANIGFSAVVGWYLLTKAIPQMQDKFSKDLDKQAASFNIALETQRKDFALAQDRDKAANQQFVDLLNKQILEITKHSADKIDAIWRHIEARPKP